jgi:hypothetical protein
VVECKELSFKIGDLEPLFCTVMLFNAKKGQRVSESFHFTLNPILQVTASATHTVHLKIEYTYRTTPQRAESAVCLTLLKRVTSTCS